jgi:hypothetical protein
MDADRRQTVMFAMVIGDSAMSTALAAAHEAVVDIEARMLDDLKPEEVANLTRMLHCIAGPSPDRQAADRAAERRPPTVARRDFSLRLDEH